MEAIQLTSKTHSLFTLEVASHGPSCSMFHYSGVECIACDRTAARAKEGDGGQACGIDSAGGKAGSADRVPAGDLQRAVFLRRAGNEMVRDDRGGSRWANGEPDARAGEGAAHCVGRARV